MLGVLQLRGSDAPIPAADPVGDELAVFHGCLLPGEVPGVEGMDLAYDLGRFADARGTVGQSENETAATEVVSGADDPLAAFADWYVSTAHRDDPANGCGVAALCTDVPRIGGPAQESYRAQVERYLARLHELLASEDPDARRRANVTLSAMVGAVMIARGLGPTERSDELLRDVLEEIQARRLLPPRS